MDNLSRLGFLTAEFLIKNSDVLIKYSKEEIGVVIANSSSSLDTDFNYQALIRDKSKIFSQPFCFCVHPSNILIGEICIKHGSRGRMLFSFQKNLILSKSACMSLIF